MKCLCDTCENYTPCSSGLDYGMAKTCWKYREKLLPKKHVEMMIDCTKKKCKFYIEREEK